MPSRKIPPKIPAVNIYDDNSFITEENSRREQAADSTCRPEFPPAEDRGFNFQPFNVPPRDLKVNPLPQEPLQLFQLFVPVSLVESWVEYTNNWVASLHESGWTRLKVSDVYIWLGILIYIGLHKETRIEDYWKTSLLGDQRPTYSIIKFMTYNKFQLLHRHLRPFDHTEFVPDERFPEVFQCAQPWSDLIQYVSTQLLEPGSHLAVDEGMIQYEGRSHQKTTVQNKPINTGFKVWVVAQKGFFLRWIWHQPGLKYGPVGVEPTKKRRTGVGRGRGGRGRPARPREVEEVKEVIEVMTNRDKVIPLNSTQSVVISLINMLPPAVYHVFMDNLFSSSDLFLSLRQHGHGATGTARANCGIYKDLAVSKNKDKLGKSGYEFNEIRVIPTADNQVNQIAWKDNALVLFMSTVFKGNERIEFAAEYNNEMNHVDRGDQLRSYHSYDLLFILRSSAR
ncbi:PiggyBac transposable element-derived protein 4 [Fusarium oxysporum f. sp. conglutinans]|nr:PiggyBac transposable element-derived protein 4 [Fusarium oxysporum f. sp. conglutinans]